MVELGYAPFLPKHTLDVSPDLGVDSEEKGPPLVGRHCTNIVTERVNPGAAESDYFTRVGAGGDGKSYKQHSEPKFLEFIL